MIKVLALDLATSTGFAVGNVRGDPVAWTLHLKAKPHDLRFREFGLALNDVIEEHRPTHVVAEAGFVNIVKNKWGKSQAGPAEKVLFGLRGAAMTVAGIWGLRTEELTVGEVRKHFLGVVPKKSEDQKKAVMTRCRTVGWGYDDNNSADALALWDCYCAKLSQEHYLANMRLMDGQSRRKANPA